MTSRRSVLKILGLAPAAAPLAAKAATDKAIGELVGISAGGLPGPMGPMLSAPPLASGGPDDWKKKVLRFLAQGVLPDWLDDDLRDRHRHVTFLDPDIACKRSWSMSVKIVTQRQRNFERAKREAIEGPRRGLRNREFEEKFGVWL